jgi:hypothetical protein
MLGGYSVAFHNKVTIDHGSADIVVLQNGLVCICQRDCSDVELSFQWQEF